MRCRVQPRRDATMPPGTTNESLLGSQDVFFFREGTHSRLYQKLGCHLADGGAFFGVWAPNARAVAVIGEFNGWEAGTSALQPRWDSSGIWERFVPGVA